MNRPVVPHYASEFYDVLDETLAMLRPLFDTGGDVIILPGSGRIGLESMITSVVEPGDRTLHVVNGFFGEWLLQITERARGDATLLESPPGKPLDLHRLRLTLRADSYKLLTVVHSETSVGTRNPIAEIGRLCQEQGVLYLVDAISSLGCMTVGMDQMNIDLCGAASQKGLGAILGLSIVGVSKKAYEVMRDRESPCHSWALDLSRWPESFFQERYARRYPVVPSTHLVYALHEACKLIHEEGLQSRFARHHAMAEATRQAIQSLGLSLFPDPGVASQSLTAVRPPKGVSAREIVREMADEHGVMIAGSVPGHDVKLFRVSHMGVQSHQNYLVPTLAALEETLNHLDYKVPLGAGVAAFERSLAALLR
jgi:alanine-glyoxylate transaminase/serine-glyoxylate transaminase/serine-pyruvate transaminase